MVLIHSRKALQAENARLWQRLVEKDDTLQVELARTEQLQAENEALREALEELRACNEDCYVGIIQLGWDETRSLFANQEAGERFVAAYRRTVELLKKEEPCQ